VSKVNPQKPKVGSSFASFVLSILAILAFRWILFEPFVIPSGSMIPTLLIHDHILVSKSSYGVRIPFTKTWLLDFGLPKRGDVIVFKSLEGNYFMIKRVVGIPGDKIEMQEDGFVKVNGQKMDLKELPAPTETSSQAPYYDANEGDLGAPFGAFDYFEEKTGDHTHRMLLLKDMVRRCTVEMNHGKPCYAQPGEPYTVPENSVFAMGDNRDNSRDSRFWGPVPKEYLMGKALFIWLSCEETLPYVPFVCNPLTLRWKRFFHVLE
jgi:signal peptidase I